MTLGVQISAYICAGLLLLALAASAAVRATPGTAAASPVYARS
ncbi:hypothetical protein [Pseudonocardia aurantiaca]